MVLEKDGHAARAGIRIEGVEKKMGRPTMIQNTSQVTDPQKKISIQLKMGKLPASY
jgi:hypothetical protein